MTREQAKKYLLQYVEDSISEHGENGIALLCPKIGKCSWSWKEYKEAVVNDTDLEDCENSNPIDGILKLDKYLKEKTGHGLKL